MAKGEGFEPPSQGFGDLHLTIRPTQQGVRERIRTSNTYPLKIVPLPLGYTDEFQN